jgi:hypothetical protein
MGTGHTAVAVTDGIIWFFNSLKNMFRLGNAIYYGPDEDNGYGHDESTHDYTSTEKIPVMRRIVWNFFIIYPNFSIIVMALVLIMLTMTLCGVVRALPHSRCGCITLIVTLAIFSLFWMTVILAIS